MNGPERIASMRGPLAGMALSALLCAALTVLFSPPALAWGKAEVKDIRYHISEGTARVVIDLSEAVDFSDMRLGDPDRVFIDLNKSVLSGQALESFSSLTVEEGGILKGIRAAQYEPDTVRVVLDLKGLDGYKVFTLQDPFRVVIDMFDPATKGFSLKPVLRHTRRVVIDPGHGGRDPGALGSGGIREKDIVLDIARKLGEILQEQYDFEVFFTRTDDRFLDLDRRTIIANRKEADLFVSIHVNANNDRRTNGIETYLLNWTNDAAAMKVAERENNIYLKRKNENRSDLGVILASLELQNKRDESLALAHLVQGSMVSNVNRRYGSANDLGVKQALFYVLLGARMPSVLVEASFITNPQEARRLKSPAYRRLIADGIAKGVKAYFDKTDPAPKIALR